MFRFSFLVSHVYTLVFRGSYLGAAIQLGLINCWSPTSVLLPSAVLFSVFYSPPLRSATVSLSRKSLRQSLPTLKVLDCLFLSQIRDSFSLNRKVQRLSICIVGLMVTDCYSLPYRLATLSLFRSFPPLLLSTVKVCDYLFTVIWLGTLTLDLSTLYRNGQRDLSYSFSHSS